MTLTIDVPRDLERALQEQARSKGQTVPEYAAALLSQAACMLPDSNSVAPSVDVATRLAALGRIGSYCTRAGLPPLCDEAVGIVYREREDSQL